MRLVLRRPAVPEQAHGHEDRPGDHERDPKLRLTHTVVPRLQRAIDAILQRRTDLRAEEEPYPEGDVVQARDADALAICPGPEHGEGAQHEVHQAVKVGHVQCQDLDDNLRAQQPKRPRKGYLQRLRHRAFRMIIFRVKRLVSRLLDKLHLLLVQQDGRICFL